MGILKKMKFDIRINASREKVWNTLWNDKNYREWTSVFTPESHALSDWKEGSKILFLDGKGNGMCAIIEKKIGFAEMVFKHYAEMKDGKEHPLETAGYESYFLIEKNNGTELRVELEAPEDYESYFNDIFPKALEKVKAIAER